MYTVKEINSIVGGTLSGAGDNSIDYFLTDSRQLNHPGQTLFIALTSKRNNGHNYIQSLVESGVKNFLISEASVIDAYKSEKELSFILVSDSLKALQVLAAYHRKQFKIPVIGITGSNGKTIVKEWLFQLLKQEYNICRSPKSYNSQIGVPLSVLNLNSTHSLAIFEAGISMPDEMQNLKYIIEPTIGVLTSFGQAHDEGFKDSQQKFSEKMKLFENTDKLVVNLFENENYNVTNKCTAIVSGGDKEAYVLSYSIVKDSARIILNHNGKELSFEIRFTDKASVLNASTCIVVMLELGYSAETIGRRLLDLHNIALRLEVKNGIRNNILINDFYNSDLDSIKIALSFLNQQHRKSKKILVVSDIEQSGRSDADLYSELASLTAQNNINFVIGIGKAISENKDLFGVNSMFFDSVKSFLERKVESESVLSDATILLKGARSFGFERISQFLQLKSHDTLLEIDLNKLTDNVNYYRSLLKENTRIMCMVKAMGYGSGSSEIAKTLQHIGVNYLAVAYADEGVELRNANITLPIMVMSPEKDSMDDIINFNLEPEIYSFKILKEFIAALDRSGFDKSFPIHLKIDTGMKRLGFESADISQLISFLQQHPQVRVKSVFSHLVGSDNSKLDDFTGKQIEVFENATNELRNKLGYSFIKHICNTAGISRFKEAHYDMVRLGIGMYGIGVSEVEQKLLRNVSSLRTCISQIKHVKSGESIGYNRNGIAQKDIRIATIPIGYADGFHRMLGNGNHGVYINGTFCKTIGNICMDMCMIDITDLQCNEGDEVVVFETVDQILHLARSLSSIPYEVLTNISGRVKRIYIQE